MSNSANKNTDKNINISTELDNKSIDNKLTDDKSTVDKPTDGIIDVDKKITRFGYIVKKSFLDEQSLVKLKLDLIAVPFKMGNYSKFSKNNKFPLYVENGNYIGVPKYYGLEKFGKPDINKLDQYDYPKFNMEYLGTLRPNQEIIVNKVFKGFDENRGGLLIAGCGSGKTNMAIYIACKYKLKTLFIVHKEFLMTQIIDRITSTTNIKKVGIIQQKKIHTEFPFVIGMVQSLSKINYDDLLFRDFGMIIIDEVHHMGARNFSKVYQKMSAKYMLGISAERQRADGMYKIINWYMGPVLHAEEQKPNDMVVVKKFHYKTSNDERSKVIINKYTQEPDRSTMVTNLVCIKRRNRFIIGLINELFDQGKNVLCLTGRLKQVNLFYKLINQNKYTANCVGKYVGGMSKEELAVSATKQIILGTYGMAEEGLDIENLNVVILCTPKSAIKQSVGRILRKDVYEEHPIVVDIVDEDNSVFKKQSTTRDAYYVKQNYNIQHFKYADYELDEHTDWDDSKTISLDLCRKPNEKDKKVYKPKEHQGPIICADLEFLSDSE